MDRTTRAPASSKTLSALCAAALSSIAAAQGSAQTVQHSYAPYPGEAQGRVETVGVSVEKPRARLRTFRLQSSMAQRDDAPRQRIVTESPGDPLVRTASPLFDALFALAVADARSNSVSEIRDGSYNDGKPIACECFQTGEKWSYVWTRDLSYAAHLGLAGFDPSRVVNSLLFKTSGFRPGVTPPASLPAGSTQIVQDTGSGGSWPVSTDRVSWAWGAQAALDALPQAQRAVFAQQAYAALRGTLEADREAAFDQATGLYGGEQSFLDWRTQSYAPWIVNNLSRMASARSLSTNVGHYQALCLGARLAAEDSAPELAQRYSAWADALKMAINARFWLDDVKQYASVVGSDEDPAALHQFDMLGTALAVVSGVASPERAREALARYPLAPFGPPVLTPQQPGGYVYHNRAIWPFVTAYALRAAAHVRNPQLASHAMESLMRGAALNLSNMENLEWLTGQPQVADGPAINSRRQLWSVGAYLGMVSGTVFGLQYEAGGLRIDPFLTTGTRLALGRGSTATLQGVSYQGKPLEVRLHLPSVSKKPGYHEVRSVQLNGKEVSGLITNAQLGAQGNRIDVHFGAVLAGDPRITMAAQVASDSRDDARVFAPATPKVQSIERTADGVSLRFSGEQEGAARPAVSYSIYRNGELLQAGWQERDWTDPAPLSATQRHCYAVQAVYTESGNRSQHSEPLCLAGEGVQTIAVTDPRCASHALASPAGEGLAVAALRDWGRPEETLVFDAIELAHGGSYGLALLYNNHRADISTGVSNAVKRARVFDASGRELASGVLQLPSVEPRDGRHPIRASTLVRVQLPAGRVRVEISDYFNMSYLQSNASYSGAGGKGGAVNDANIAALQVIALP